MDYHLTVTEAFRNYARGDHITDPAEVEAVLASHASHVVPRFPHAEHADGRFYMSDEELAAAKEAEKIKAEAAATPARFVRPVERPAEEGRP